MGKPQAPHGRMQTVVFTCTAGDTVRAPHNEVARLRKLLKNGCTAKKLLPGVVHRPKKGASPTEIAGVRCGCKVKETVENHATPARVEPSTERETQPEPLIE